MVPCSWIRAVPSLLNTFPFQHPFIKKKKERKLLILYWSIVDYVVIVSSGQQRDSAIHTHVSNLSLNSPPIQTHNIEQSSPCYTVVSISLKSPHSRGHTLASLPKLAFHASNMLYGLSPEPDLYFFTAPFTRGGNIVYFFVYCLCIFTHNSGSS